MNVFERSIDLPGVSSDALYRWHVGGGAFQRLLPPWERVDVLRHDEPLAVGGVTRMRVHLGPLWRTWEARIDEVTEGRSFVDRQITGPMSAWTHEHHFDEAPSGARLTDRIEWRRPWVLPTATVEAKLRAMFARRHRVTAEDLQAHATWRSRPRMTVGITGGTGLIGTELAAFLRAGGHRVVLFSRRAGAGRVGWDPDADLLDPSHLEGLDAVVHLAGEPIAGRWTPDRLRRIRDSRVRGTRLVAEAMARCARPPRVLVSCSAIGVYGAAPTVAEAVDERSPVGTGFLAEVGVAWEAAAEPARQAGVRVVHPRVGLVLSGRGGFLAAQLPLFRLCLGGRVGTGEQGISWVALDDAVHILHALLQREDLEGPFNLTAPHPVSQLQFAEALAAAVGRPVGPPAPAAAIRASLGEMGEELVLRGARVLPARLAEAGYSWRRPTLADALAVELGHWEG